MQKPIVVLLAMLLAATGSADGQQAQVGRYQMVVAPASQSQTFPEAFLLDTAIGQSWMLYHETGQVIQWLPLRFSAGKDRPTTPLPPSPDAVGGSRHWTIFMRICLESGVRGPWVSEAWFAALAIEHGCTWISYDRFPRVEPTSRRAAPI
jgi:hypothetical protein